MQQSPRISRVVVAFALAAALTTPIGAVSAQDATTATQSAAVHDPRWQPWLGCWSPSGAVSSAVAATMLCVVPGKNATSVEIVNFSGGAVTDRAVIDPGQSVAKEADQCKGSETATWSGDGRRVMLRGTFTCARGAKRTETGVMSINADGEWVQAQSIELSSIPTLYVAHFRNTGMDIEGIRGDTIIERPVLDLAGRRISPPRYGCTGTDNDTRDSASTRITIRSAYACAGGLLRVANAQFVRRNGMWTREDGDHVPFSTASVRADAGAPVTTEDVLEVARIVDPGVAESWITDRNQTFPLSGKELMHLADRGMPSRVIDVLVAISNPKTFTMHRNDGRVGVSELAEAEDMRRGEPAAASSTRSYGYGMTGIGWMYGADLYYGWNPYDYRYNYLGGNRYRYGNGYGYGYGQYWGSGYSNGGGPPVVIVGPAPVPQPRGRAVYGQGYTRSNTNASSPGSQSMSRSSRSPWYGSPSGSTGTSSGYAPGGSSPRSAPSSAPSSTSGGSSSGSSSGSSGGEARTAKPRGGGN